jgi:uncharacterized repeat protein (TIGR04138 family)
MFVLDVLSEVTTNRRRERGSEAGPLAAREDCDYLLTCRGNDTSATLRELGLRCSEDVGRVVFATVNNGLAGRHETDKESDFDGLFVLD